MEMVWNRFVPCLYRTARVQGQAGVSVPVHMLKRICGGRRRKCPDGMGDSGILPGTVCSGARKVFQHEEMAWRTMTAKSGKQLSDVYEDTLSNKELAGASSMIQER